MGKSARFTVIFSLVLAPLLGLAALPAASAVAQAATGTVIVHAVDKHGKPLAGACYVTSYSATSGFPSDDPVCDSADGSDDGDATITTQNTGPASGIIMVRSPKGYLVGSILPYALDPGGTVEMTFKPQKGGQPLDLTLIGEGGKAVTGACFNVFGISQLGYFTSIAASGCAGAKSNGRLQIAGLPPGHYEIYPRSLPENEASSDRALYTMIGQGNGAKLTFHFQSAGTAKFAVLGPDGASIAQTTCFNIMQTKTANPYYDFLCPSAAGDYITNNLPAGTYVVASTGTSLPAGMQFPDKLVSFKIKAKTQTSATIQLETGGQALVFSIFDPAGNLRPRACAEILTAVKSGVGEYVMNACQGSPFVSLKPGDYVLQPSYSPVPELAPGPGVPFTVVAGQEADVTAQLLPSATITVSARDKKRKNIADACFRAAAPMDPTAPLYSGQQCDSADGAVDGVVTFTGVPAGTAITLTAVMLPDGWALPVSQTVTVDAGATLNVKFGPKLGDDIFRIRRFGAGRDVVDSTCYAIYASKSGKKGDLVTNRCDYQDYSGTDGLTVIPGMAPGDYIAVETYAPTGVTKVKDAPFTITAGEDNEIVLSGS